MDSLLKLRRNKGATKAKKRLGRGNGSGTGTYAGRGRNGQKSRNGGNIKPGFAGGQTPLYRKMPKYKGFKNVNRIEYQVVNVSSLNDFEDNSTITNEVLHEKNLINTPKKPVKILGNGELKKKLNITVNKVSASAKEKIIELKGTVKELNNENPKDNKEE